MAWEPSFEKFEYDEEMYFVAKILLVQAGVPRCDCPPDEGECGCQYQIIKIEFDIHGTYITTNTGRHYLKCVKLEGK